MSYPTYQVYRSLAATARFSNLDPRTCAKRLAFHGIKPAAFINEGATRPLVPLFTTSTIEALKEGIDAQPTADLRHIGPDAVAKHLRPDEACGLNY